MTPRVLLAAISGVAIFLATAAFDIWPLAWIALLPLFWSIVGFRHHGRTAFFLGWITGWVANLGGFYWVPDLLVRFGHLPFSVSVALFVLLAGYQGFHWGVSGYLIGRARNYWPEVRLTWIAPAVITAMELTVPFVFDWYLAITQAWVPEVIQVAEFAGPSGVTFLIVLCNAAIFDAVEALCRRIPIPRRTLASALVTICLALIWGKIRMNQVDEARASAEKVKVGVVQGNMGIFSHRTRRSASRRHQRYLDESHRLVENGAELILWPESAYPFAIDRKQTRDYPSGDPRNVTGGLAVPLIFGALSFSGEDAQSYNSAFMIAADGRIVGRADKNYLLVFGEYIPFHDYFPAFQKWVPAASQLARGKTLSTFPFRKHHRIGPMICYEDLLPAFGRQLARLEPNLLVNLTNDAWFGRTAEPYQHLALSVFRTVELRLDLIRAVNTGVSTFIDANGRLLAKTESHDPLITPGLPAETLAVEAALMPPPTTVYARVGDLFGYLMIGFTLILIVLTRRR